MNLPTVEAARAVMLAGVAALPSELVPLDRADGRWLVGPVRATRDQPPFNASAMDGWAVRDGDAVAGARLTIVGESAAGHASDCRVEIGQAARIFTGAAMPAGADRVLLQEDAAREGEIVLVKAEPGEETWVRPRGGDFREGAVLLEGGIRLNPWRLALAASAGCGELVCGGTPRVAILATGDEIVDPGASAAPHQIYNSAAPAVAAFARRQGATARLLPTAGDDETVIRDAILAGDCDLLVTIGGASVGDHDKVKPAIRSLGGAILVEGVAVRPGKPVWFAVLGDGRAVLGLPGNPASAMVCAELFLGPLLAALQHGVTSVGMKEAILAGSLPRNGPRDHYMRAKTRQGPNGTLLISPLANQDSSLVTVMASATVLLRRPPHAPALEAGAVVEVMDPSL